MPIVAYGYGLSGVAVVSNIFVDDIQIELDAEPDITVDDDIVITAPTDDITITVDPDITIEVE